MRKRAVEELGNEDDKRALNAIHEAKKKDAATKTGWFGSTCLGDRPDEAEKKILAYR